MEKGMERREIGRKGGRQTTEKNTWEKGNTNNGSRGWVIWAVFIFCLLKILLIFFLCVLLLCLHCVFLYHMKAVIAEA